MPKRLQVATGTDGAGAVTAMVERLAGSRMASLAAILIVALACFLPGFSTLPPFDGDEPAYVVGARGMAASGDFATIRVQTDRDGAWRPLGEHWLAAVSALLAGQGSEPPVWVYRIPSLIAAVAVAMLTWWTALALGGPRAALLAGLFVAGSGVLGLQARLAAPDAALVAATTLAVGALARIWLRSNRPAATGIVFAFWGGLAAGILPKGPVAPAMVAMTLLVLSIERGSFVWLKRTRPVMGLIIVAAALTPWGIAVFVALISGGPVPDPAFLARIGVPSSLEAPPGTYALLAPLLAGPAMTFIFLSFAWIADHARKPAILFALAWGVPFWLAMELIQSKLPQNILPVIPAVAVIAALAIDAGGARLGGRISVFFSSGPLVWPPIVAVVMPVAFWLIEGSYPFFALVAFAAAACCGPVAWLWLRRGCTVAAAVMSVVTVVFIYLGFFGVVVPGFSVLRVSERTVAAAASTVPCAPRQFAVAGYPEESFVIAAGPETLLTDGAGAADFLNVRGCRVAAVDTSQISSFRQRAEDLGIEVVDNDRVPGFNLRKMVAIEMHVFTAAGNLP
ncbi:glycosyltransferase family 39 protein [soil metagenome]